MSNAGWVSREPASASRSGWVSRAPARPLPVASRLVDAIAPAKVETPQAVSSLRVGTITATSPLRVTLTGSGTDVVYSAEKLTAYTAVNNDPVLVAVIGQRVIIIGKIG